jgi:hypothetical protein
MPGERREPTIDTIDPHTPLRLAEAVRIAFPTGSLTVSGLRKEIAKGRLVPEVIAGKVFVTLRAIEEMRRLCRVQAKVPAFISNPNAAPETEHSGNDHAGSSATDQKSSAQDALRRKLEKLKAS